MKRIKLVLSMTIFSIVCLILLSTNTLAQNNPKLTDAEVASVAVVANQIDINYAEIAKKKSKDADILKFAETMTSDHKAVIGQAAALVQKLGVEPKDNAVSQKLMADAEKTKKILNSKSAETFDKAYIDNEVEYHKAVIAAVETILIPETENQELKDLLQKVLPTLRTHLEHATMVQHKYSNK